MDTKELTRALSNPMEQIMGVILGGGKGTRLYPLTKERSKPAVPFAGNYRIVDIPISNCINSGINRVYVMTQYNSASLNKHISEAYKFDIFHKGFVEILASEMTRDGGGFSQGTADAVRRAFKNLIAYRDIKYLLILSGDQLYRMDFRKLFVEHIETGADITMGVIPIPDEDIPRFGILQMDSDCRITGFFEKPRTLGPIRGWEIPKEKRHDGCAGKSYLGSMGMYLFNIEVIEKVLLGDYPDMLDFGKEVIPECINNYKTYGFLHSEYWEDIGTISSYLTASLELTKPFSVFNFYEPKFPFFSRPRFLPPVKLINAKTHQTIIGNGAILENCEVSDSVIGMRSIIRKGAVIQKSVIIGADYYETLEEIASLEQKNILPVGIGENTIIKNAIVDKNCRIGKNVKIINEKCIRELETDSYAIVDGIVVINKNSIIPDGTVI
jgi:glucose-1-phosphate adenylyltransferase